LRIAYDGETLRGMGYVENNLMNGETIQYRASMHWLRYGWAAFWLIAGVFSAEGRGPLIFLAVVLGILAFLDVKTSEFVITNRRVFLKQGILRRRTTELLLSKIEGLQVEQGILGRIFNFGTIVPGGSGGTKQQFRLISKPLVFRGSLNQQIETGARSAA
jgi:uncharacterized membrane protein YdbT with pleckstrin-like domain